METFRSNTAGVLAGAGRLATNRLADPTPAEATAVVAAIEQFVCNTAPVPALAPEPALSPWKLGALTEAAQPLAGLPNWRSTGH